MMLEISRSVMNGISRESAASPSLEVCGLVFGDGDRITGYLPCDNVAARPHDSFEIDPATLIAAYRAERSGGPRIVGCYHSHPSGFAQPSPRDAVAADANSWVWLIIGADGTRAFRAVDSGALHDRFDPVEFRVT